MKKILLLLFGLFIMIANAEDDAFVDLIFVVEKTAQAFIIENNHTLESFAEYQIKQFNDTLINSEINDFKFRLVHVKRMKQSSTGEISKDGRMIITDEYNVKMRNEYGADILVLYTNDGNTDGGEMGAASMSLLWNTKLASFKPTVVSSIYGTFKNYFPAQHEVGHVFGAEHSREQTKYPGPGFYASWNTASDPAKWSPYTKDEDYSAAYYIDVPKFGLSPDHYVTLMGYVARGNKTAYTPINYYSSPLIKFKGITIGNAISDNRRIVIENWKTISKISTAKTAHNVTITENSTTVEDYDVNNKLGYTVDARLSISAQEAPENYYFSGWKTTGSGSFVDKFSLQTIFIMGNEDCNIEPIYKEISSSVGVMKISTTQLNYVFGETEKTIKLENIGLSAFDYQISTTESWINISSTAGTLSAKSSKVIKIKASDFFTPDISRNAEITITSKNADCSPRKINVIQKGVVLDINYALDNSNLKFSSSNSDYISYTIYGPSNTKNDYCIAILKSGASISSRIISDSGWLSFDFAIKGKSSLIFEVDEGFGFKEKAKVEANEWQSFKYYLAGTMLKEFRWTVELLSSENAGSEVTGFLDNIQFIPDIRDIAFSKSSIIVNSSAGTIDFELINVGTITHKWGSVDCMDANDIKSPFYKKVELKPDFFEDGWDFKPNQRQKVSLIFAENILDEDIETNITCGFVGKTTTIKFTQLGKSGKKDLLVVTPDDIDNALEVIKNIEVKTVFLKKGNYTKDLSFEPQIKTNFIGESGTKIENLTIKSPAIISRLELKNIISDAAGIEIYRCSVIDGILTNPENIIAKSTLFWKTINAEKIINKENCASEKFAGKIGEIDEKGNIKLDVNNDFKFGPKLDVNNKLKSGSILINRGK